MSNVQARPGELLRQLDVAFHDRGLGCRLHAAQAQAKRGWAVVHGAAFGHARIFRVLNHAKIDLRRQAQRLTHHRVIEDGLAVVGDAHGSGTLQSAEISEHSAFAGMSRGADRENIDHRAALWLLEPGYPVRRVDDGLGIGHATYGSETSGRGGSGPGGDGLLVALAGLAQMDMQVDESGRDDQATSVEFVVRCTACLAWRRDLRNLSITQQDVHGRVDLRGGVDETAALDQQAVIFFSSQFTTLLLFRGFTRIFADSFYHFRTHSV